jgi:hypothetical protein
MWNSIRATTHSVPAQHVREYANATKANGAVDDSLMVSVSHLDCQDTAEETDGVNIVVLGGNGLVKVLLRRCPRQYRH